MFFGVPVCACLYSLVTFIVEALLKKKALPIDTEAYAEDGVMTQTPAETPSETGESH